MTMMMVMLVMERWQEHVKVAGVWIDMCSFLVCRGKDHAHALVYPQDITKG